MNESEDAFRMFSFAATITSIVLAVVSIVFSIISGIDIYKNLGSMRDASDSIDEVSKGLKEINDGIRQDVTKLSDIEGSLDTGFAKVYNYIESLEQKVGNIADSKLNNNNVSSVSQINESSKINSDAQGDGTKETFDFINCAKIGIAILYASYLSNNTNKPFSPQLCGDPNYVHGFLVAMEINHPNEFRLNIILVNAPMMQIFVFDSNYFKGVEDAAQKAKQTPIKPIIEDIEKYFNVK